VAGNLGLHAPPTVEAQAATKVEFYDGDKLVGSNDHLALYRRRPDVGRQRIAQLHRKQPAMPSAQK